MTRGVPVLGYRLQRCGECLEFYNPKNNEITYLQIHYSGQTKCPYSIWLDYWCGCKNVRAEIDNKLGLDTEEKRDNYQDNEPDCTCKKKIFEWLCEDCRMNLC